MKLEPYQIPFFVSLIADEALQNEGREFDVPSEAALEIFSDFVPCDIKRGSGKVKLIVQDRNRLQDFLYFMDLMRSNGFFFQKETRIIIPKERYEEVNAYMKKMAPHGTSKTWSYDHKTSTISIP